MNRDAGGEGRADRQRSWTEVGPPPCRGGCGPMPPARAQPPVCGARIAAQPPSFEASKKHPPLASRPNRARVVHDPELNVAENWSTCLAGRSSPEKLDTSARRVDAIRGPANARNTTAEALRPLASCSDRVQGRVAAPRRTLHARRFSRYPPLREHCPTPLVLEGAVGSG